MTDNNPVVPPPGSAKAVALLCTCPVMDNQYGRGYRYVESAKTRLYVINADCPLHGSAARKDGDT
jgi:hypothetical protein